jgi:hypothetical protein
MKRIIHTSWTWFDRVYARFAKILLIVCLLAATGGVIIGTTATVQSARNADATHNLVDCLKRHGAATSIASTAVRDASALKDAASLEFTATLAAEGSAFQALVTLLTTPGVTQEQFKPALATLRDTLADRSEANIKLIKAQAHLDRIRAKNPVPPPPAIFCGLEEGE